MPTTTTARGIRAYPHGGSEEPASIAAVTAKLHTLQCSAMLNCCQIRGQLANLDEQQSMEKATADAGQSRSVLMLLLMLSLPGEGHYGQTGIAAASDLTELTLSLSLLVPTLGQQ